MDTNTTPPVVPDTSGNKSKSVLVSTVAVGLVVLAGYFLLYTNFGGQPTDNSSDSVHVLSDGAVVEVTNDGVMIEGYVGEGVRTILFTVDSTTVLTNEVSMITNENLNSGEGFVPTVEVRDGSVSGLNSGVRVISATSREDLSKADKVKAVEIRYATYEFPQS